YEVLEFYGPNLVSTEGANWKRHRAVAAPAFNEANNVLVWTEAIRVVNEWFAHLPSAGPAAEIDVCPTMTQATFLVIASAGFGRALHWSPAPPAALEAPAPGLLPFSAAVLSTTHNIYLKAAVPALLARVLERFGGWRAVPFLDRVRATEQGYRDLRTHIVDMVSCMRADVLGGPPPISEDGKGKGKELLGAALLRNLVEANLREGDGKGLTDDELLSNVFVRVCPSSLA
ncbi:hypothetical protein FIBSPDRAFT_764113, partial [Athelia psychrophila]